MAASYIEALLAGPRWNNDQPVGRAVDLKFDFMTSVPSYTATTGFQPFTPAQEAAARAALDLYEDVSRLTFTETSANPQLLFGRNAQPFFQAGYASYPGSGEGGDVWLNIYSASNDEVTPGEYGFSTLVHEVGHALGLKHPFDASPVLPVATDSKQYTVMSYDEQPDVEWREEIILPGHYSILYYDIHPSTLMLYDIAAIQYLYGKNMTTRAGNDTYEFDPGAPFLQCIWDAGGTDTISVSNFSRDCTINLNAGKFSSIAILPAPFQYGPDEDYDGRYEGLNNLSIAFGAKIERATGGSGNDRLIGNAFGNVLTGNDGNDSLDGGAGNDVLDGGSGTDRLIGGGGNDVLVWQASDTRIDGGGGTDVLRLSESLDLVAIINQKSILNIETIDMNGSGGSTLTLAKNDVLDISSITDTLKILGDADDMVVFIGFTKGALKNGFVTWKSGTAIVRIEDDIVNVV